MLRRKLKRYSVAQTADGYEIRDADAAGAHVFFSVSRRAVRDMSRALNRRGHPDADRADYWKGAYGGGGGGAG